MFEFWETERESTKSTSRGRGKKARQTAKAAAIRVRGEKKKEEEREKSQAIKQERKEANGSIDRTDARTHVVDVMDSFFVCSWGSARPPFSLCFFFGGVLPSLLFLSSRLAHTHIRTCIHTHYETGRLPASFTTPKEGD